ncbi:hypothetical protein D3C86_2042330 [compost metagenome]
MTPEGKSLHDRILVVALEREKRLLADFSPAEIDMLVNLLGRMHARVNEVNEFDPSQC